MPFKKGHPGGPGRPKKELSIPTILREIGDEPISPDDKKTKLRAVLERVFVEAMSGEAWATNFIADRTEGKPVQQIISENENKITVEYEIAD